MKNLLATHRSRPWAGLFLSGLALLLLVFHLGTAQAQQRFSDEQLESRLDDVITGLINDPAQAWSELENLREAAESAGNPELWADWNLVAAYAHQHMGQLDEAEGLVSKSLALYKEQGSEHGRLDAILARGQIYTATGRFREAIVDFESVLTDSAGLDSEDPQDVDYYAAGAHQALGDAYTVVGDFGAALEHIQAAYRIFDRLGDQQAQSATIGILGNLYIDMDAADKALEVYREGTALDRSRGDEVNTAINLYNMGRALTDLGLHDEARDRYAESLEISRKLGNRITEGYIYYGAGLSFADEKRATDARESFEQAAEILEEVQDDYMLAKVRYQLARLDAEAGEVEASNVILDQVLVAMQRADSDKDLVEIHGLLSQNHAALDNYELAYQHAASRANLMQTLASEERARRTAHLRVQFDTERAEARSRVLSEENRLKAQLLQREQRYNRMFLIGVLLLLLISIALSYSIWRQKQLEKSLTLLANTDDLTGQLNRRRLFDIGTQEVHRALRYDHTLVVLLLDLDHFKKVNDRYGHSVGDVVLRKVATHVAGGLREEDWLARFGGEEFVAILPHTDRVHGVEVAERLRKDVEELDLAHCGVDNRLTLSIGVAWLQGKGDTFQMMINRADAALYEAKEAGRNRIVLQDDATQRDAASAP